MSQRNRSEGWHHAKLNGHKYELKFCKRVSDESDIEFHKSLRNCFNKMKIAGKPIKCDSESGKKMVTDIFGGNTQSKRDASVEFDDGSIVGFSLKKPSTQSGQVHLTTLSRFLEAIQYFTSKPIPQEVEWVFRTFTGETEGKTIIEFVGDIELHSSYTKKHNECWEIYQNRLYCTTLEVEFPDQWLKFIEWFDNYLPDITKLVFMTGYCKNKEDHAEILHYGYDCSFFDIKELINKTKGLKIIPSKSGSTITMPWGFLQVHRPGKHEGPYQLQFHHILKSIKTLMD